MATSRTAAAAETGLRSLQVWWRAVTMVRSGQVPTAVGAQKGNGRGGGGGGCGGEAVRNSNDNVDSGKKGESLGRVACVYTCAGCPASGGREHPPPSGGVPSVVAVVYARENIPLHDCYAAAARRYVFIVFNNNIMVRRTFDGFRPTSGYLNDTAISPPPSTTIVVPR